MQGRATVFIACCNRLLRESVARILGKRGGLEILAAQAPSSTSWEEIGDSGADVLVLDSLEFLLRNPVLSSKACALRCSSKCVLIAMTDDHNNFLMAVQRGARGYVLQDASAIDVVSAICTVAEGRVVCPPQYAQVLFDFVATQTAELPNSRRRARWGLTRR